MRKIGIYILLFVFVVSCLRLDDNLYNNKQVAEYRWDLYDGQVDFTMPSKYDIPFSNMNQVVLDSKTADEVGATKIYGIYVGDMSNIKKDTVILYCHGNRDHMDFYWPRAKALANVGGKNRFGVFMFDYRGYGRSRGKSSEETLYADTKAAIDWLASNGVTSERLIIYGFSMGSAPATFHASKGASASLHPSKLILENPISSASAMVQDAAGLTIAEEFVTSLKIDNAQAIKTVTQPFLLLLSEEDKFLRRESHGDVIYKNYQGKDKYVEVVPEADHGELVHFMKFTNYFKVIEGFITK